MRSKPNGTFAIVATALLLGAGALRGEDCNGNGYEDAEDIAADPALDLDGDGVLEECAALPVAAFRLVCLNPGAMVVGERNGASVWQIPVPAGAEQTLRFRLRLVLSVHFELCENEPEACGGGSFGASCLGESDEDGDGRVDRLDPDCHGVQGWSVAVMARPSFRNATATTVGTVADLDIRPPGRRDSEGGSFERTEIAEWGGGGMHWGVVSAVALSFHGSAMLLEGEHPVMIFEGDARLPALEVGATTDTFEFRVVKRSRLSFNGGPPVETVVTVAGVSLPEVSLEVAIFEIIGVEQLELAADFIRGDANADGRVDIADAISILNDLFRSGPALGCLEAADVDASEAVDLSDAIALVSFQFAGESSPAPPYPACGDAAGSPLGCEASPAACR